MLRLRRFFQLMLSEALRRLSTAPRARCARHPPSWSRSRGMFGLMCGCVAPSHHHFLYVASGSSSREAILSASAPTAQIELRPTTGDKTNFLQFIEMGIEHIATGIDHLAFLLALLITARTARQVLAIVTGFTLGHSLTLSLAVLGIVQANRG